MRKENTLDDTNSNPILVALKNTLKAKALKDINTNDLVQWLTKQQFCLDQGEHNQFMLLFLLVLHGEQLKQFKVASLSPRKNSGEKKVYRIGLTATSEQLGEIGIEARIYDNSISLQVLSDQSEALEHLIKITQPETISSFQKAGFNLIGIEVLPLQKAENFNLFMQGQVATEVDVWV